MQLAVWVVAIVAALFALDRLLLWMEAKGWVYWRKVKRKGSAGAAALSTFNEVFDPSSRHAAEVREEHQVEDEEDGDDDAQRPPEDRLT